MAKRLLAVLGLVATLLPAAVGGVEPRIAVIVHPSRRDVLDAPTVARIYLRQRRFWDDGTPVLPLNREAGGALREQFSRRVLGAGSEQLAGYWNSQYFHGVLPPATLSSSQSIRRFGAAEPDAIGYVEAEVVDSSVRVALIVD